MSCDIKRTIKNDAPWDCVGAGPLHKPFSACLVEFCHALSERLWKDVSIQHRAEVAALAFWLRRSNTEQMASNAISKSNGFACLPRGTVFHVVPSNIDTMFAYSWTLSLLCGNRNIVRLPTNLTGVGNSILSHIDDLFQVSQFESIAKSNSFCQYDRSVEITTRISALVDTRLIWGGDSTIAEVRTSPIPSTANEFAFADKISVAAIAIDYWKLADEEAKSEIARKFTIDSMQFGQSACSSPRILIWVGGVFSSRDRNHFWDLVTHHALSMEINPSEITAIDKLVALNMVATQMPIKVVPQCDIRVSRAIFSPEDMHALLQSDQHCGNGLFFETAVTSLSQVFAAFTRRLQTFTYAGIDKDDLVSALIKHLPNGIDRVVPFGCALEFSHVWDGQDLFEVLLRRIRVV
jgi:hypothetical protein